MADRKPFVVSWSVKVGRNAWSPRYADHDTEAGARAYAEGVARRGLWPNVSRQSSDGRLVAVASCSLTDGAVVWEDAGAQ